MSVMACGEGYSPRNRLAGRRAALGCYATRTSMFSVRVHYVTRWRAQTSTRGPRRGSAATKVNNAEAHPRAVGGCARVSVPRGRVGGMRARRELRVR